MRRDIITSCIECAKEQEKADDGYVKLECGFATILFPGINIPYLSRDLWAGVMPF
jgi:fatty acid synthase subunit alpha, fungi type